ncbi:MAG: Tad domain-containing protein [Anaerolineae bacterium]|nr:Tad domain-containing protein [Anaerolineae bacterium]
MENRAFQKQDGQSIILVAVAFVALLLFVALAVDMSNAYAHRRQAQNAADSSALAAARALGHYLNGTAVTDSMIKNAMIQYAQDNGIADTDGAPGNGVNDNVIGCYLNWEGNCIDELAPIDSAFKVGMGLIPAEALGIEVVVLIESPTYFGGIVGLNGLALQAEAAALFESACTAGGCVLPIAVHARGFDDEGNPQFLEGQCYNLWDGEGSGQFGWLNWSFQGYPCKDIGAPDDCSEQCLAANMDPDHCVRIDPDAFDVGNDVWIGGKPGISNGKAIADQLDDYILNEPVVRLVVYNETRGSSSCGKSGGGPDPTQYHLAGFAAFKITGYRLSQGKGKVMCDLTDDGALVCKESVNPSYVCDPMTSLDYPPCYAEDGVTMVPCATSDSVTNRITGQAQIFDDGEGGNCGATGNLLAPRLHK